MGKGRLQFKIKGGNIMLWIFNRKMRKLNKRMDKFFNRINKLERNSVLLVPKDLRKEPGYEGYTPHTWPPIQMVPIPLDGVVTKILEHLKLSAEIVPATKEEIVLKKEE